MSLGAVCGLHGGADEGSRGSGVWGAGARRGMRVGHAHLPSRVSATHPTPTPTRPDCPPTTTHLIPDRFDPSRGTAPGLPLHETQPSHPRPSLHCYTPARTLPHPTWPAPIVPYRLPRLDIGPGRDEPVHHLRMAMLRRDEEGRDSVLERGGQGGLGAVVGQVHAIVANGSGRTYARAVASGWVLHVERAR